MLKIQLKTLFLLFIILLSGLVGYAFYAYRNTDKPNNISYTPIELPASSEKSNDKIVLNKMSIVPPEPSVLKDSNAPVERFKEDNVSTETIEEIEVKTQRIYNELLPDDYDETIEDANIAFDNLDIHVAETSQEDAQIMEEAREVQEINNDVKGEEIEENEIITIEDDELPVAEEM